MELKSGGRRVAVAALGLVVAPAPVGLGPSRDGLSHARRRASWRGPQGPGRQGRQQAVPPPGLPRPPPL